MTERRNTGRERTLKGARIAFHHDSSVIDCIVRNRSDSGACLQVASPLGIPDEFDLIADANDARQACRVIWRTEKRIGVEFR
jgi:hypothetical protein